MKPMRCLWTIFACAMLALPVAAGRYSGDKFVIAQLVFSGDWNPRPEATKQLVIELMNRTSINAALAPRIVTLGDNDLFFYPFLLMTGQGYFAPFSKQDRERLRLFLDQGGFLLIDNSEGTKDGPFDQCVRRELTALFPDNSLSLLPLDHSLYRSFYLMREAYFGGRVRTAPFLEGITIDDATPVVYSLNDAAGAWAKGPDSRFLYDVIPGGERQRQIAFNFGVNAILYALTANYKKDAVHVKALMERGKYRKSPWIR